MLLVSIELVFRSAILGWLRGKPTLIQTVALPGDGYDPIYL